jgi:hypothetical protein
MGGLLALLCSRAFRVEWDLIGLVLRSCRIGATSSWRNWTRIPLGTENCRSLLQEAKHARESLVRQVSYQPSPHWRCTMDVL